ncbi:MAG: IS66 family transposase, partial [Planctomycetaceae bacterium]|nr:IS66 family transposase [Planctomycetaceae bacterium]
KTRERIDPRQLLLFDAGELEALIREQTEDSPEAEESLSAGKKRKKKRGHGRGVIPDNLPREEILHELPEDQRQCPVDGKPMPFIRWETSEQLEYVPSQLKVLVHKRAVYACPDKHDEATLLTAPKPPQPIEKGLAGPGLLAAMVVGKFGDHLPGYRLEDILARHGSDIHRSTVYDWLSCVADLLTPLYDVMKQRVLSSRIIHTDDTKVKLIDHGIRGTRTARFWAYLGDRRNPYEVYDFTTTRERAGPEQFLGDFQGYLQADAYSCYDGIYLNSTGTIIEVACWAHTRRYWHKSRETDSTRAHHVLAVISRLYEIERACKDQDAEFRLAQRQEHAAPLLVELKTWLDEQHFLPKSIIGQAATYTRNQWTALNCYLEDGELSIDNNAAERTMKPVAIGRKNWLFVGSPEAGARAAVLMSLIASCKANEVEPWAWLNDVLTQIPAGASPESLLPDHWLQSHPRHRWEIARRRRRERLRKRYL